MDSMPQPLPLILGLALLAAAPAAAETITDAEIRTLAARQAERLGAGDVDGYAATFAPGAVFTQQALGSNNAVVPYGQASLAEARVQLARTLARSQVRETVDVRAVVLSASGRGAALRAFVRTRVTTEGRVRESCAWRIAGVARIGGRLRTVSQTDTLVRCRGPA